MVADISLLACSSFRKDPPRASDKEGRFLTSLALPEAADEDSSSSFTPTTVSQPDRPCLAQLQSCRFTLSDSYLLALPCVLSFSQQI